MRVLIGCEFGAGRGHITFATNVATVLRQLHPSVEIETHVGWSQSFNDADLQNPLLRIIPDFEKDQLDRKNLYRQTLGFTLFEVFNAGPDTWSARLNYWRDTIKRFRPDVILAEYAPGLSMYARGRIPTLVTGTGYSIPPTDAQTFPEIHSAAAISEKTESECVEILNRGLKFVGAKPLSVLPEINAADFVGLVTLPIFDPYWNLRHDLYLGAEIHGGAPSPKAHAMNAKAYFSSYTVRDEIWKGIAASGVRTEVYQLTDLPSIIPSNVELRNQQFRLAEELPGTGLVIHVGGLGFTAASLHAGVPQILLYDHDEHWVHANAIVKAQIGLGFSVRQATAQQITKAIQEVLQESRFRQFALALSEHYKPFAKARPSLRVANEIALMAGSTL